MLSDCTTSDQAKAELFIVRSGKVEKLAKRHRDWITQAVLPVDFSLVKADGTGIEEVLDNNGFLMMIASLGVGICLNELTGKEDCLDLSLLRYGKIIVAMNDSSPGYALQSRVLALMRRFMSPVIAAGHVYALQIGSLAMMYEDDFVSTVMSPTTRNLVQVAP